MAPEESTMQHTHHPTPAAHGTQAARRRVSIACPRCEGRLLYDGIELVCLLCGYERYPDTLRDADADPEAAGGPVHHPTALTLLQPICNGLAPRR
jgi:ribosomal protein L37E